MDVYIDKDNLLSLLHSSKNEMYEDCVKLMKRQLNIIFNFPKEEIKNDDIIRSWILRLTEGVGNTTKIRFLSESFPPRPLKDDCYNSFEEKELSSVYLLNDEKCDLVKKKGCILISDKGGEINTLTKLFFRQNDYLFEKKVAIDDENFKGWIYFRNLMLPLSDIIMVDNYIFEDEYLYDFNLYPLVKLLVTEVKVKLNIVFVSKPSPKVEWSEIKEHLKNEIKQITGFFPNITFIQSSEEHDRTILTNYHRIISGDSFNYFDSKGRKITKGREIYFLSLANRENYQLANRLSNDLQTLVDKLKTLNSSYIIGDRVSNLIKF